MIIKNVLIKGSGDVTQKQLFLDFCRDQGARHYTVVIPGAGTQGTKALKRAGYEIRYDERHGRITETWEERRIMRDVLELEEKRLQDRLVGTGVHVVASILYAGSVLCHINGDNLVKAWYLGFDEIYVFTAKDRLKDKEEIFAHYPKVRVVGL